MLDEHVRQSINTNVLCWLATVDTQYRYGVKPRD